MKIVLNNIQSFKNKQEFDIEEHGVYLFTGNNSNGKSILGKVLADVIFQRIKQDERRLPLINDDVDEGMVLMNRNDYILGVKLHRDADRCLYVLKRPDGTEITRHFREGGINELLDEFGFIIFDDEICLQLVETFGMLPFVNLSGRRNAQIVKTHITDAVAETFRNNFKDVTFKRAKAYLDSLKNEIVKLEAVKSSMVFYDTEKYASHFLKLKDCYDNLKFIRKFEHEKIELFPDLSILNLPALRTEKLELLIFLPQMPEYDISESLKDYITALEGRCPVCGQIMQDEEGVNHEHSNS